VRTLGDFAAASSVGVRTLERKCAAAGVKAKAVLDLVTCIRALRSSTADWRPETLFSELDPRTASRLLQHGGLNKRERPTIRAFIADQQFLTDPQLKHALSDRLCS
jgi:hypothetical protein